MLDGQLAVQRAKVLHRFAVVARTEAVLAKVGGVKSSVGIVDTVTLAQMPGKVVADNRRFLKWTRHRICPLQCQRGSMMTSANQDVESDCHLGRRPERRFGAVREAR